MSRKILFFCLFFLLISIIYTRILFIQPTTQLIGDGGDNYEFMGYIYLIKNNLINLKYPFAHTNIYRYPVGFNLSYGYDGAFYLTIGVILSFFIPLILAYNLTIVIILWLNIFLTFLSFKKIFSLLYSSDKKDDLLAFIGGLLYGASPYVFARLNGHPNLAFVAGFPILLSSTIAIYWRLENNKSLSFFDFFYLTMGLVFIVMGSLQYILLLVQILLLTLIILIIILRAKIKKVLNHIFFFLNKYYLHIIFSIIIFFIPFIFFYGGHLKALLEKKIRTEGITFTHPNIRPQIIDIFIPNSYLGLWWKHLNSSFSHIERVVALGIVEWIIIFFYLFLEKKGANKLFLIFFLISLFTLSVYLKPFFIPEPGRVYVILSIPIFLLITIFLKEKSKYFLYAIIFFLLFERSFFQIKATPPLFHPADEIVKKQPGQAVLQIPLDDNKRYQTILPYLWNKAIFNGSFHHLASTPETFKFLNDPDIKVFSCNINKQSNSETNQERILKKLKTLGVSTIVILKNRNEDLWWFKECANVRRVWENLNPQQAIPAKNKAIEHRFEWGRGGAIESNLIFNQKGQVMLERITIYPQFIDDFFVATPGGIIKPPWKRLKTLFEKDLIYDLFPESKIRLTFQVSAGDKIHLFSQKQSYNQNVYAALWYLYLPSEKNKKSFSSFFKLLWKDELMEIYSLK